ncbi:MAG: DMT family transporter [Phormidesmis sp.]
MLRLSSGSKFVGNAQNFYAKGIAIALTSTATWATAGIFIRWLPGWSPFAILAGRFLIAMLALLPIVLSPNLRHQLFDSVRSPFIWALSLPMIGGYLLGTTAFQMAPVGEVTLLISTSPLFVVAYKLLAKIRVHRSEGTGTALATAGISLILLPQISVSQGASWQAITGYAFALTAAGLLAVYTVCLEALARRGKTFRSVNLVFVTCLLGCLLSFFCTAFSTQPTGSTGLSQVSFLVLLGLGILSTATSTLFYTIAAQRLPALLSAAILLTEPIFAVLFASVALKEIPSLWFGIGSLFVLGGLFAIATGHEAKAT